MALGNKYHGRHASCCFNSIIQREKRAQCDPDIVTFTSMTRLYCVSGQIENCKAVFNTMISEERWENEFAMFQEMEMKGIQPDLIACAALMRAFNKGNQPAKVVVVAEYMHEKKIPMNDSIYFEMLSACSILRDWRKTIELIEMMEPSFNIMSIGLLNQLLHSIGKLGKTETTMKIFYKIVATGAEISSSTYSVLLKNLLAARNWRKYLEAITLDCLKGIKLYGSNGVMEWMEDSGVQASVEMYLSILSFAQSSGREYSVIIQDRVECLRRKTCI